MHIELMDFEQRVSSKIRVESGFPGFPHTKTEIADYLLDKQAILDSAGSQRTQYTIMGVMIVLPVVVFSAFPQKDMPGGNWAIFVALAIGLCLAGLVKLLTKLRIKHRLKSMADKRIERYIEDVLNFKS